MISLAVKYRPKTFDEVVEQSATKVILKHQLENNEIMNAYLFCGGAGTGKTTTARIFAKEINKGKGVPIELDAASNNSVEDAREIIQQSKTVSLESEYKIFIMDEVHALSGQAWQAMLKVLEEPPAKSIFIMCTTDPQKIPKTILSRVQRFNFQRISQKSIVERLDYILKEETCQMTTKMNYEALEYIAKQAQGGMRDAITMLDKCLSYATDITIDVVIKALGLADFTSMTQLLKACATNDCQTKIDIFRQVYMAGKDLKYYTKGFTDFVLDYNKWAFGIEDYLDCPTTDEIFDAFKFATNEKLDGKELLSSLINLQNNIKWDTNPRARIEAWCFTGE